MIKGSKVLVVSTSRKTRGGITAVLKAYESTQMWQDYYCHWVGTHVDRSNITKLWYYISGLVEFCLLLPFYDIVHIHYSLQTTAKRKRRIIKIAKIFGKKVVTHLHCGSQIDAIWNKDYELLIGEADKSVFLSNNLRKIVEAHTGPSDRYTVVYNPCISDVVYNGEQRKKDILFAATLYEGKGYKDFIKAFAKIAHYHKDWTITLAGNGEVEQGKALAKELDISSQVLFLGWVNGTAKDKAFKEACIFCLPSYAEGFPMAVLDAFSYGIPVITTPVGGIPDVAIDGENMLLFNPGDVDALAKCMENLISDENLQQKLSKASKVFAATTFNLQTIVSEVANIYENL